MSHDSDVVWLAFNLRQTLMQEHHSMSRTARQQVFEIMSFRDSLRMNLGRDPSKADIVALYKQNAKMAKGQDCPTFNRTLGITSKAS